MLKNATDTHDTLRFGTLVFPYDGTDKVLIEEKLGNGIHHHTNIRQIDLKIMAYPLPTSDTLKSVKNLLSFINESCPHLDHFNLHGVYTSFVADNCDGCVRTLDILGPNRKLKEVIF